MVSHPKPRAIDFKMTSSELLSRDFVRDWGFVNMFENLVFNFWGKKIESKNEHKNYKFFL